MLNLLGQQHNPDVLMCMANLSNDEVFTPPSIAEEVLDLLESQWAAANDGEIIWRNPTVRFLDPVSKSGVFLREITRRLCEGLQNEIPDLQNRVNHILTNQVFGLGITQLTALLSRRSLYCSKYANGPHSVCKSFDNSDGNIWFQRTEHTWVTGGSVSATRAQGVKDTDRRCAFCGVKEAVYLREPDAETHAYAFIHTTDIRATINDIFGEDMHFDVVIGNPPYQLSDGGGKGSSALPIYQKFVEQAKNLDPTFVSMIIPSRWFNGGKNLDDFRREMLADHQLRSIVDFQDARDVFDGVDIAGGVCYFLWQKNSDGPCEITTRIGDDSWTKTRYLGTSGSFIRDNRALTIVEKARQANGGGMSVLVSPRRPFNIDSSDEGDKGGDLYLFRYRQDARINSARLGNKGAELVDTWRVLISKTTSEHAGQTDKGGKKKVLSRVEIMPPGSVCTESYLVIGPLSSKEEASNMVAYLRTRFARFLLSTVLRTQNITRTAFDVLPKVDLSKTWIDSTLYEFFELSDQEVSLIESTIREF